MKFLNNIFLASALAGAATASATVVVDATGVTPGSVQTITQALATTDLDILVKNTGVYNESLLVTRNVTIRGEDPNNRPIITLKGNLLQPRYGSGDGVYVGGVAGSTENQTIALKNLIFLPATTDGLTGYTISASANANAVLSLTLENILIAPNNGSDAPLATSVWDNPDLAAPGVVRPPWAAIYMVDETITTDPGFNGDIQAVFKDVVVIGATTRDGIVVYAGENGNGSVELSGVGTSYNGRYGAQFGSRVPFTITGTKEKPGFVSRKNVDTGIVQFQGSTVTWDNVILTENGTRGTRVDADTVETFNMTESLIALNGTEGFWSRWTPEVTKNWTISSSTLYKNGRNGSDLANIKLEFDITSLLTLTITDTIIAGSGSTGIENISNNGNIIVNNSGLVTAGPDALLSVTRNTNTVAPVINNAINADPVFSSVAVDPLDEGSFDVNAAAYVTASSENGNLNGWGEGPGTAAVSAWSLY